MKKQITNLNKQLVSQSDLTSSNLHMGKDKKKLQPFSIHSANDTLRLSSQNDNKDIQNQLKKSPSIYDQLRTTPSYKRINMDKKESKTAQTETSPKNISKKQLKAFRNPIKVSGNLLGEIPMKLGGKIVVKTKKQEREVKSMVTTSAINVMVLGSRNNAEEHYVEKENFTAPMSRATSNNASNQNIQLELDKIRLFNPSQSSNFSKLVLPPKLSQQLTQNVTSISEIISTLKHPPPNIESLKPVLQSQTVLEMINNKKQQSLYQQNQAKLKQAKQDKAQNQKFHLNKDFEQNIGIEFQSPKKHHSQITFKEPSQQTQRESLRETKDAQPEKPVSQMNMPGTFKKRISTLQSDRVKQIMKIKKQVPRSSQNQRSSYIGDGLPGPSKFSVSTSTEEDWTNSRPSVETEKASNTFFKEHNKSRKYSAPSFRPSSHMPSERLSSPYIKIDQLEDPILLKAKQSWRNCSIKSLQYKLPAELCQIASDQQKVGFARANLVVQNKLLFPIPNWQHNVRILHPTGLKVVQNTNRNSVFLSKQQSQNALLLAMNEKRMTPYQTLKAFQKTRKLLIEQGIQSKQHPALVSQAQAQHCKEVLRKSHMLFIKQKNPKRTLKTKKSIIIPSLMSIRSSNSQQTSRQMRQSLHIEDHLANERVSDKTASDKNEYLIVKDQADMFSKKCESPQMTVENVENRTKALNLTSQKKKVKPQTVLDNRRILASKTAQNAKITENQYDSPSENEQSPLKPRILPMQKITKSSDSTLNLDWRNNVIAEEFERELQSSKMSNNK